MEWSNPNEIPAQLQDKLGDTLVQVKFTQWESDLPDDDESMTEFDGYLIETAVAENRFQGLDGAFHFKREDDESEIMEILMDFPPAGEDVTASWDGEVFRIFGNESMLEITKKA